MDWCLELLQPSCGHEGSPNLPRKNGRTEIQVQLGPRWSCHFSTLQNPRPHLKTSDEIEESSIVEDLLDFSVSFIKNHHNRYGIIYLFVCVCGGAAFKVTCNVFFFFKLSIFTWGHFKKEKSHSLDNKVICVGVQAISNKKKKRNKNELELSQVISADSFCISTPLYCSLLSSVVAINVKWHVRREKLRNTVSTLENVSASNPAQHTSVCNVHIVSYSVPFPYYNNIEIIWW